MGPVEPAPLPAGPVGPVGPRKPCGPIGPRSPLQYTMRAPHWHGLQPQTQQR